MVNSSNLLTNLKKYLFNVLLLCAVALSAISQPAYAQLGEFKINASDGGPFEEFGYSVSISGDYAVVGANWNDDNGSNAGSAYIFKRTGTSWAQQAKLLSSDAVTMIMEPIQVRLMCLVCTDRLWRIRFRMFLWTKILARSWSRSSIPFLTILIYPMTV